MYKAKLSERNRPYALKRSDKHRPVCTCGTYLKTAYVLNRSMEMSRWIKIGYYCPTCFDFYREPPVHLYSPEEADSGEVDILTLKHNLEKMFSQFD